MSIGGIGRWETVVRHPAATRAQSMARHERGWGAHLVTAPTWGKSVTRLLRYRSLHSKIQRGCSGPALVDGAERPQSHEPGHARELRPGRELPAGTFHLNWRGSLFGSDGVERQLDWRSVGAW